jgi:anti-sigma B factor antagonist
MAADRKTVVALDGELTIYRAAELKATLLAALSGSDGALEIDLAGVTEIDSAGVQLLLAARRSAQAAQREFALVGHGAAVADVFRLLDLGAHFAVA